MEEKSTEWVFALLAYRGEQISVIDTILVREQKASQHIFNDIRETIIEGTTKPLATSIQSLLNLQVHPSTIMCCLIRKTYRKFLTKRELKAISAKKFPKIDQLQICHHILGIQTTPTYLLQLFYFNNKYKSILLSKEHGQLLRIKNIFTHSYLNEVASVIVKAIDSQENKQVLKMELEFIKDNCNKMYLHQVNSCIVLPKAKIQDIVIESLKDLDYFIQKFKAVKHKNIYLSPLYPSEKQMNTSKISIESFDSDNEEDIENKSEQIIQNGSRLSVNSLCSSSSRSTRRASSIKLDSDSFSRRSTRKSNLFIGTMVHNNHIFDTKDRDDSADYGNCNIHFLEMISRQMIKEANFNRPISPGPDELKQQIRMVYEKMSLTPSHSKVFNYNSSFPMIKVSPDPAFSHNVRNSEIGLLPNLRKKSISQKILNLKPIRKELAKGVLSRRKLDQMSKKNF